MRTAPVTAARFSLTIDGHEIAQFSELQGITTKVDVIGAWPKVEGLAMSWDVARHRLDRLALASGAGRTPFSLTFVRHLGIDMRLMMWHRSAAQRLANGQRDAHMHMVAWHELVMHGDMATARNSVKYRLFGAWPSKIVAGGLPAGSGTGVAMETITLTVERIEPV